METIGGVLFSFGYVAPVCDRAEIFGAMVCWVLLCYGGGFGIMPSFVSDEFGQRIIALGFVISLAASPKGRR